MSASERALGRLTRGESLRLFIGEGFDAVEVQLTQTFTASLRTRLRDELQLAAWNEARIAEEEEA